MLTQQCCAFCDALTMARDQGMTRFFLPAALLAFALSFAGWPLAAGAATMNYCETYADRVAQYSPAAKADEQARQFVRDKAFYTCLNMDEEPPLPESALGLFIDPSSSPFRVLDAPEAVTAPALAPQQPPASEGQEQPAQDGASVSLDADTPGGSEGAGETGPAPADDGQGRGSGHAKGSDEWEAFCAKYYPNSFDPKTGTVIPAKLGRRVACR
jgi:hypothetical protein